MPQNYPLGFLGAGAEGAAKGLQMALQLAMLKQRMQHDAEGEARVAELHPLQVESQRFGLSSAREEAPYRLRQMRQASAPAGPQLRGAYEEEFGLPPNALNQDTPQRDVLGGITRLSTSRLTAAARRTAASIRAQVDLIIADASKAQSAESALINLQGRLFSSLSQMRSSGFVSPDEMADVQAALAETGMTLKDLQSRRVNPAARRLSEGADVQGRGIGLDPQTPRATPTPAPGATPRPTPRAYSREDLKALVRKRMRGQATPEELAALQAQGL